MADTPGHTFGRVADAYERTRPGYPDVAIEKAIGELGLTPDMTVLDLAAGTGKLTRQLRERFAHVVAVEPDESMRALVGGDARAGTAEAIPLEDSSVDAVFVGSAFHWFDFEVALSEIARVLRPGGGLAMLWNSWGDKELLPEPFQRDIDDVWARFHDPDAVFPDWFAPKAWSRFGPVGDVQIVTEVRISGRDMADLWLTGSTPASIPDEERDAIAARAYPHMRDEYVIEAPTRVVWARLA